MRRITEAALLAGSAAVAGLGAALVDFGKTGRISWAAAVVFLAFGCCLAGLVVAVRRWAPGATPFLVSPAALLVALGLVEIYRIDPTQAPIQMWWVVAGVVAAIGVLAFRTGMGRLMSVGYWLAVAGLCLIVLPFLPRLLGGGSDAGAGLWLTIGWGRVSFLAQPFGLGCSDVGGWSGRHPLTVGFGSALCGGRHPVGLHEGSYFDGGGVGGYVAAALGDRRPHRLGDVGGSLGEHRLHGDRRGSGYLDGYGALGNRSRFGVDFFPGPGDPGDLAGSVYRR